MTLVYINSTSLLTTILYVLKRPTVQYWTVLAQSVHCVCEIDEDSTQSNTVLSPVLSKTPPGLHSRYLAANNSMIRSIFWASPGRWKLTKKALHGEQREERDRERKREKGGRGKGELVHNLHPSSDMQSHIDNKHISWWISFDTFKGKALHNFTRLL